MSKKVVFKPLLLLIFASIVIGCGVSNTPKEEESDVLTGEQLRALYARDLESLSNADPTGLVNYDYANRNRFKQIFSGHTGAHLRRYFDERIKFTIAPDDDVKVKGERNRRYLNWFIDPDITRQQKDAERNSVDRFVAFNFGAGVWFDSLVEQIPLTIIFNGVYHSVDSSRVGFMQFGAQYKERVKTEYGFYTIPNIFRHETLLHEARHSDCTGGISEADLEVVRNARNPRDYEQRFKRRECTHKHIRCPIGHVLEGILACDDHPWGAYSISAIYYQARTYNFNLPIEEWNAIFSAEVEMKSRVLIDFDNMIRGSYGDPDMIHLGLL